MLRLPDDTLKFEMRTQNREKVIYVSPVAKYSSTPSLTAGNTSKIIFFSNIRMISEHIEVDTKGMFFFFFSSHFPQAQILNFDTGLFYEGS